MAIICKKYLSNYLPPYKQARLRSVIRKHCSAVTYLIRLAQFDSQVQKSVLIKVY